MTSLDRPACICGCGETPLRAESLYRQGHDQRHIQELIELVLSGADPESAILEIPTVELRERFKRELNERQNRR